MENQLNQDDASLTKPIDGSDPEVPSTEPDQVDYPDPSDGIVMHIDELKENLASIQEETGVDPNLLPEIEPD